MNKQQWLVVVVSVVLALAILAGGICTQTWVMSRPGPLEEYLKERDEKLDTPER